VFFISIKLTKIPDGGDKVSQGELDVSGRTDGQRGNAQGPFEEVLCENDECVIATVCQHDNATFVMDFNFTCLGNRLPNHEISDIFDPDLMADQKITNFQTLPVPAYTYLYLNMFLVIKGNNTMHHISCHKYVK
jgi:hypothetical protein